MNKISVVGLGLAKQVFQVHGVDASGKVVIRKALRRKEVLTFFAQLKPCLIGMEACGGMHHWARTLGKLGHEVKAMAPAFVKPYLKSNKNDRNDAEAICEAVQRPSMRFVAIKSPEQQAVLHLHHARQLLVQQRVAIRNHIHGLLQEYGLSLRTGPKGLSQLWALLEDADNDLPDMIRVLLQTLKAQHDALIQECKVIEAQLQTWHKDNETSQRLETIPGVGLLTATALAAHLDQGQGFTNGRQLAAYLGLVPRQASSGGKNRLLSISKRGDGYLRTLLVHGARSLLRHVRKRLQAGQAGRNPWLEQLLQRCHPNEAAVALANKMARIAWVLVSRKETWRAPVLA